MIDDERAPRRPPYWLVPIAAALLLSPPTWAILAFVGVAGAAGTARVAIAARERRAARKASGGRTLTLGVRPGGEVVRVSDDQLSAHGLILGASGAGKSTTLLTVLTDRIARGLPVVAVDLKGSPAFARELQAAAAAAGRPFALWTPDGPSRWNPLAHGNPTELKDKLIGSERFTEPHYQRAAERYVQTVLQVLERAHPGRPPDLAEVVALMDPRRLPAMLTRSDRGFAERVQDYLAGLTPDQQSAIRGLGTRLAIISESHTGQYLSGAGAGVDDREIDLRRALSGDEVVLFSLNSSTYGNFSAQLGTLVVQDLIAATGDRLARREAGSDAGASQQAMVAIDEFSALGGDHVISLLARARAAGVSVMLATQELADLDRAGPGLRDQIVGNTAIKIVHRQDVPASAQTIAQMTGTRKVWERTYQSVSGFVRGFGGARESRRLAEEFVIHPNQIKRLRTGEAVVLSKLPVTTASIARIRAPRVSARGDIFPGRVAAADASKAPPAGATPRAPSKAPPAGATLRAPSKAALHDRSPATGAAPAPADSSRRASSRPGERGREIG